MPKLAGAELGRVGAIKCALEGCTRGAMTNAAGAQLPFCRAHLEALPRAAFDRINASAGGSVYDLDAVSEAVQLVAEARLALKSARKKP